MAVWREWRRPRSEWLWAAVAFTISYVVVVDVWAQDEVTSRWQLDLIEFAYLAIGLALCYRVFVHSRVTAGPTGIEIANPFRANQFLAWDQIASMRPDRLLIICDQAGRRHIAWVIQKNGWSRARGLRAPADEAVDELGRLATQALGAPRSFAPAS